MPLLGASLEAGSRAKTPGLVKIGRIIGAPSSNTSPFGGKSSFLTSLTMSGTVLILFLVTYNALGCHTIDGKVSKFHGGGVSCLAF